LGCIFDIIYSAPKTATALDSVPITKLLMNLADDKPLSGFFLRPQLVQPLLKKISQKTRLSSDDVTVMIDCCPIFWEAIHHSSGHVMDAMIQLAGAVSDRILECFSCRCPHLLLFIFFPRASHSLFLSAIDTEELTIGERLPVDSKTAYLRGRLYYCCCCWASTVIVIVSIPLRPSFQISKQVWCSPPNCGKSELFPSIERMKVKKHSSLIVLKAPVVNGPKANRGQLYLLAYLSAAVNTGTHSASC
jgi:hypothetical protein